MHVTIHAGAVSKSTQICVSLSFFHTAHHRTRFTILCAYSFLILLAFLQHLITYCKRFFYLQIDVQYERRTVSKDS